MRLGFDVDGVFADWNGAYIPLIQTLSRRDLFGPGYQPTSWHYDKAAGYTDEEISEAWEAIKSNPIFWMSLKPYWDAMTVLERIRIASYEHDVYFITSRPGVKAKHQTEVWLATHSGDFNWGATVLISSNKGACAKALNLDAYIDDRFENCHDVANVTSKFALDGAREAPPSCRTFMIDRPWNEAYYAGEYISRVDSVAEMLDQLGVKYDQKAA